jgi:hypothetical protein
VSDPDLRARGWQRHPDVYVGAALLAFCGVAYWNTTTFGEVSPMLSQNVPPTFFPRLVLTVVAVLSAALVVAGWRRKLHPKEKVPPAVFVTGAVITGLVVLVPRLGMLATVCLAAIVLPLCWGERRVLRIAWLAVGLPLAIHLIFVLALDMRLPRGLLP